MKINQIESNHDNKSIHLVFNSRFCSMCLTKNCAGFFS